MNGKRKKTKKRGKKWLFAVEILVLLILAVGLFGAVKLGKMDRMSLKNLITNEGAASQSGYQNIVFYGVDSREGKLTEEAHSDTIIVCSINKKTKEIKMASVYRDTYLDNTNGEYRKATECYYFGGPERSINMLNKNLDLDIRDYVTVDFNAVVKAVDLIGGIDMEITDEELTWLNGYCQENSAVTGVGYTPLDSAGYQHLDGIQTLAYCRIRYTEGYDFKRTERQRDVLTKIFEKAKAEGVTTLLSLADTMLPYISTSLSNTELISLVSGIGSYTLGESTGFPFYQIPADVEGAGDCVVPVNLTQNVSELHGFLFGTEGYTPSQTVQDISSQIVYSTGIQ
ncbi:MAG: LCP family protein [Lachnospiraceae bacterium]|nr:LCP family protein [Lachnospiraceae bacterium]